MTDLVGRRLRLLVPSGRLPCIDMETGEKLDFFVGANSIIHIEGRESWTDYSCMILKQEGQDLKADIEALDEDLVENYVYHYREAKLGAND